MPPTPANGLHATPTQHPAYSPCRLCPRRCGANRLLNAAPPPGACGQSGQMRIARAAPHHWEEPCLSGTRGSGTVFFTGCGLGCVFCQNAAISRGGTGYPVTEQELAEAFLRLQQQGVHNLNLVTATHFTPGVLAALALARQQGLTLPVVWNTGGYETADTLATLAGQVDIWLFDVKFAGSALAAELAGAPDYPAVARAAALAAAKAAGPPRFSPDGLLQKGLILRLLVLPGHVDDANQTLTWAARALPKDGFLLSIMRQYTPPTAGHERLPKALQRPLSTWEYRKVVRHAEALGLQNGYTQGRQSTGEAYLPPFTGTPPGPAGEQA